ncbi:MAG: hypothetical protein HY600_06800, partial [Candidatus Omnitrophica bacterium]|nr:hypothetical protein [Candidatus Omnitrophota bacterium]
MLIKTTAVVVAIAVAAAAPLANAADYGTPLQESRDPGAAVTIEQAGALAQGESRALAGMQKQQASLFWNPPRSPDPKLQVPVQSPTPQDQKLLEPAPPITIPEPVEPPITIPEPPV